ncbi:hypothetical protein VOLCADRAFT_102607 [Volvox carteri f. nagariensis]|uniref:Uncharacterized protein n=1 Tax=Volvox carteri f. nagariensis TaxID=3068 RepID=D8TH07_VOLCA|nr:uncharacterized protein VOLCADRAFT_102607 [Volvox carteri f. nagariensis]EFJ52988.1 hypothetical protein VOLCADRAFT_102607 [Volvox carteri f. nagariensis]|eukprot:XP_002945993.1 hypothetical protein VOLCADRAFT_102607 [Volvox carteri f. nagariensis]
MGDPLKSAGSSKQISTCSKISSLGPPRHVRGPSAPRRAPSLHRQSSPISPPGCPSPPAASQPEVKKGTSLLEWANQVIPQGQLVNGVKQGWRLAWQVMMQELAPQTRRGQYSRPQYAFSGRIGDGTLFPRDVAVLLYPARQVYDICQPGFRGRCTAPLMVDRVRRVAVCNESSEIVRSLDEMHLPGCTDVQLRPRHLTSQIDELNAKVSGTVDLDAARVSYFKNLFPLNPGGIVPAGPTAADLQLEQPAGRGCSALQGVCYPRDTGTADAASGAAAGLSTARTQFARGLRRAYSNAVPSGMAMGALMRGASDLEILPRYFTRPAEAFELEDLDRYDLVMALDSQILDEMRQMVLSEHQAGPDRDYYLELSFLLKTGAGGLKASKAVVDIASPDLSSPDGAAQWEATVAALILSTASLVKYLIDAYPENLPHWDPID